MHRIFTIDFSKESIRMGESSDESFPQQEGKQAVKNKFIAAVTMATLVLIAAPVAKAQDKFSIGAGYYDIIDDGNPATDLRAEYRWDEPLLLQIKPFVGIEGTTDGGLYGLGGLYMDWGVAPHWYLTPSFGAGLYSDGDGKDLGHVIEFRSQIELAYEFDNAHRVSVGFGHISNASLGDDNPGTEILNLYYHLPVDWMSGQ